MDTKKSILTTLGLIMVVVFVAIIINITLNLREFGFNSACSSKCKKWTYSSYGKWNYG